MYKDMPSQGHGNSPLGSMYKKAFRYWNTGKILASLLVIIREVDYCIGMSSDQKNMALSATQYLFLLMILAIFFEVANEVVNKG